MDYLFKNATKDVHNGLIEQRFVLFPNILDNRIDEVEDWQLDFWRHLNRSK